MDAYALLCQSPLFGGLPVAELRALASHTEHRIVEAGRHIVRVGAPLTHLVWLALGTVALYRHNRDREVTLLLGLVEAPALLGDAEWGARVDWTVSMRAERPSSALLIPVGAFEKLLERHGELSMRLYRDACVRHLLANHTAQAMALYDVETRLLRLLVDYATRLGRREAEHVVFEPAIAQTELAAGLGVDRRTIARALQPLTDQGVLERNDQGRVAKLRNVRAMEARLPKDLLGLSSRLGETVRPVGARWSPPEGPEADRDDSPGES